MSSCSSGMKSPHSVRRRPPTEFSGFESSFRMWVFGFAMERRLASIGSTLARVRSLLDDPLGLLQDRAGQTGEGITGRNQLAVLTLHGLFSHARQTRPQEWTRLSAAAIRGFDSGFGLGFVVYPLVRFAAVFRKSFVFSSLPIRKVLVLHFAGGVSPPFPVVSLLFSVSYPQASRSYYLFFTTCSLTTCMGIALGTNIWFLGIALGTRNGCLRYCVRYWKTVLNHTSLWK